MIMLFNPGLTLTPEPERLWHQPLLLLEGLSTRSVGVRILTSSSREKQAGFKDPTLFSKSGKGLRKTLKKPICLSLHAGFNGVFRISKLFFVFQLFQFEVEKISKFFDLEGCLTSLFKKLGKSFEKLIFQKALFIFPQ